jgi:hypothetical protein
MSAKFHTTSRVEWPMGVRIGSMRVVTAPATPADSPLTLDDVMSSPVYLELRTPALAPGEAAFPFDLPRLDAESHRPTGERVRLADFAGKRPVALVFGSYT